MPQEIDRNHKLKTTSAIRMQKYLKANQSIKKYQCPTRVFSLRSQKREKNISILIYSANLDARWRWATVRINNI
jgi:hypothetical protein